MNRILTIQDISCVGRCSLTVALPIISAAGVEAAILPTAVLSTHTAFPKFTFRDLTDEIKPITDTFADLGLDFSAIYTGYLGSFEQLSLVSKVFDKFKTTNDSKRSMIVIDPVMADNGKLYSGFTPEFAAEMAKLCRKADLVLPNLTEAAFLLGDEYDPNPSVGKIRDILKRLTALGAKKAALTGFTPAPDRIGFCLYDSERDEFSDYTTERLNAAFHGTGDIFASAAVGALMRGISCHDSLKIAADFTKDCMARTLADPEKRFYGVNFEEELGSFAKLINDTAAKLPN